MIFSDLPSPPEAGLAKAENQIPLFRIMLSLPQPVTESFTWRCHYSFLAGQPSPGVLRPAARELH
jgi:hypothetical protein